MKRFPRSPSVVVSDSPPGRLNWTEHVRIFPDLVGKGGIGGDRDHPISLILQHLSTTPIFVRAASVGVARAIDEYANPGSTVPLKIKIRLREDISVGRVLREIGKAQLLLV